MQFPRRKPASVQVSYMCHTKTLYQNHPIRTRNRGLYQLVCIQLYSSRYKIFQGHGLSPTVQCSVRAGARFQRAFTSDLGEIEARGGSSNEVHCAVHPSYFERQQRTCQVFFFAGPAFDASLQLAHIHRCIGSWLTDSSDRVFRLIGCDGNCCLCSQDTPGRSISLTSIECRSTSSVRLFFERQQR